MQLRLANPWRQDAVIDRLPYFVTGEFRLTALDDGRTRLEGTTWYTNRMWPAFYWRLWSDAVIHRIHLRVLNHIKNLAEAGDGK